MHTSTRPPSNSQRLNAEPGGCHFFQGASNLVFNAPVTALANVGQWNFGHLHLLDVEVAPNAILNAGGRVDIPKCYPGTREEVISKVEHWIASGYNDDRRIFWLSGPAGAGKSAIMQTIAESCAQRETPMANFFFFRADDSRNHSRPIVATLLRQLIKIFPDLKSIVDDIIARDGLVFRASLREQFGTLIDAPIRYIRQETPDASPIVLLIDGLDECEPHSDAELAAKSEQRALLRVLDYFVSLPNSSFITLVASRVESHIEMEFNNIGRAKHSIYLDEEYRPDADIRTYITGELSRIKRTHPLGQQHLDDDWPSQSTLATIIEKSSGQFIYPATACRFMENSPQSPALTLEMVVNARPARKHSPFAEIDALYSFILSRCHHWDEIRSLLALNGMNKKHQRGEVGIDLSVLGYSHLEAASFFSDVTAIIKAYIYEDREYLWIHLHHASLLDFIDSRTRAGQFYVDLAHCANVLAPRIVHKLPGIYFGSFWIAELVLQEVDHWSEPLTQALRDLASKEELYSRLTGREDLLVIKKLCSGRNGAGRNEDLYRQIENAVTEYAKLL